ncbi:MAG: hypothetical protein L6R41_007782 [Letrouitia leprolyta]|nr:MAG: hypothetical protein L6R41_007782 [Letrouitia leprolyta]
MASVIRPSSFIWINSLDGRKPGNPSVRTKIRRQAMNNALEERKRQGKYGMRSRRQYPIVTTIVAHEETDPEIGKPPETIDDKNPSRQKRPNPMQAMVKHEGDLKLASNGLVRATRYSSTGYVPTSPSSTGYEAMRIRYDFDVLDLSALTALHVGRATAEQLQDKPACLREILRSRQWSYFSYMPWRYGQTKCLDDALCCVAARARQWVANPGSPNGQVLMLYCKAVKSLQTAIDDPVQRMQADVLCATEVLSIFQLLDTERFDSWTLHAAGAANLIRLRGPERYKTPFEKALFLAQAGPIITEATLDAVPCFLEEPAWQQLFQNVVLGKSVFSYYSDMFVKFWACISAIPGLARSVLQVLRQSPNFSQKTKDELRTHIFEHRSRLMRLGVEEKLARIVPYGQIKCSCLLMDQATTELQHDVLGVLAMNLMRLERLIVALDSSVAPSLEAHVQELARNVMDIESAATAVNPRAFLSLTSKITFAKSAILTGKEWWEEVARRPPDAVMNEETFERWINLICPWRIRAEFKTEIYEA